ncbi:Protein kinase alk2 [Physocladia obscura]|uniref:Protein kinase alk2 n=1 Tax=Physocladia obscura TaxID=109957 RepID=A0AAD5SY18_9FUNG|nr:Protein kinase alk2 [Physocladia obscura]
MKEFSTKEKEDKNSMTSNNSNSSSSNAIFPIIAGATAITAILAYIYREDPIFEQVKLKQKLNRAPGVVPFLGDLVFSIMNRHRIHDRISEMFEITNNEPFVLKFPFFEAPLVFVNDPKVVEHVLKTKFGVYEKGPFFRNRASDVLGHGIFNSDGQHWKDQRKIAANIFNVKNFKEFVSDVFTNEMKNFSVVLSVYAKSGEIFDLQELFFRFTLDSFTKIGFGIDLNSMTATSRVPFAVAFDSVQTKVFLRFLTPLWQTQEALFGAKKHTDNIKIIRDFGLDIIKRKRQGEVPEGNNDLLSLLLKVPDENGNPPSDELLVDYVMNFLIAGRDTTAQALSWTFYLLHTNPNVFIELQKEIGAVLDGAAPTYDQIKNAMPYANAVFHESLRLYPSVPLEIKQANTDDTLPDGTFIPNGATVSWSPYAMGRTEAIWGPTAKEFKPERWLQMERQPSPFDYPVFNAGPRVCLGKNMAELEGVFVMVEVARQFRIEVVNTDQVTYANSLTLPMINGLRVRCFPSSDKREK